MAWGCLSDGAVSPAHAGGDRLLRFGREVASCERNDPYPFSWGLQMPESTGAATEFKCVSRYHATTGLLLPAPTTAQRAAEDTSWLLWLHLHKA